MKIYGISGLGADKRVFKFLKLDSELIPIDWIKPLKNESISNYSKRLSAKIDQNEKVCLIGVSFGGLVTTEISKLINPALTILISSAETKKELPFIYGVFGKTNLVKLFPTTLFDPPRWIANFLFGTEQTELLNAILKDTDLKFAKWAVHALISWKNEESLKNVIKIHGTKDKLIPLKSTKNIKLIKDGEHFMIVDKAQEISTIINAEIRKRDSSTAKKGSF
ncbi:MULTISPECIES: alpha/beta hydrolase [unclassified Polaribacter]|uniref:alpha/beta hydrolase n=1 Tax=unclassified Polaribacter TaxID=196858 RepID=UPI0011BEFCEC|nr:MULTISPECIES: alpha/beta hydrolase [unclassified Polaribacter]TXD51976.1 alpha/beta hydrolase [Polaribacter sp. IC063]TXD58645.1 alpha/beta hydrolase [Polaribacter sp. IC066]